MLHDPRLPSYSRDQSRIERRNMSKYTHDIKVSVTRRVTAGLTVAESFRRLKNIIIQNQDLWQKDIEEIRAEAKPAKQVLTRGVPTSSPHEITGQQDSYSKVCEEQRKVLVLKLVENFAYERNVHREHI